MFRRQMLVVGCTLVTSLGGCVTDSLAPGTEAPPSEESLPAACPRSPDVEGLPARPAEFNSASVAEFLADYEYTLAPALNPDYPGINFIDPIKTEQVNGGYRVHFFVEWLSEESSPVTEDGTPTPIIRARYSVAYYIDESRVIRKTREGESPTDTLQPRENGQLIAC